MSDDVQLLRDRIVRARSDGRLATWKEYLKLSGPGWLQSAITLGGGSLAGSLYLGIIGGYEMMWLQPLMMIFGVVMLSAIAYVTLCSGERPFRALNTHVSPVLGWSWIIATVMANLVWAMPQFSLGTAAMRQNLGLFTFSGGEYVVALLLFLASAAVVWLYDKGGAAFRMFDWLLKLMVAVVVVSFFMVVLTMSVRGDGLPWSSIFAGFIPNPCLIFEPPQSLQSLVQQSSHPGYWHDIVVSAQRDRMVAAAATVVGINMTFLMPYSLLKRGWDKEFRGLVRFDLSTGLFIPFLLATSCVVLAAASQFHARPEPGLISYNRFGASPRELPEDLVQAYETNLTDMMSVSGETKPLAEIPQPDRILAATLIQRDAFALANSLEKFTGKQTAQVVFGIGVVGMAVSSIVILMLINGFAFCEMLDRPSTGLLYRIGCMAPGVTGALGALFLWSGKAKFYLAVPTSRFGMVLLPIAYISFFFMMNNQRLLGDAMPKGMARCAWNTLMGIAVLLALTGASISILNDAARVPGTEVYVKHIAMALVAVLVAVGMLVHFRKQGHS